MTEPTVTFPVVPIDMATICRLLTVRPEDQAIAVMTASTPPLEGEMMFALPRVTKKYGNRGRSKQFAPNVCAIVTLSQLNLLLRMTNFIRRDLNEAAFNCPFVGVFKNFDIIGKGREQWNIVASRRAPTITCFVKEGKTPPCAGDSLVIRWTKTVDVASGEYIREVRACVVGIGNLTDLLKDNEMYDDSVLVPIGVLKHSPSKVSTKEAVEAYHQAVTDYEHGGHLHRQVNIGSFHFGLVDVELGCNM
jgi:hypothetical protein